MIVMPANNAGVHDLSKKYPGFIGMIMGPGGWRDPRGLTYAFDNGKYPCYATGKQWVAQDFLDLLAKAYYTPRWVVVPDEVGDAVATCDLWQTWAKTLQKDFPIALAVQDGMTVETVHKLRPKPDVIFVGGTTDWKRQTIWQWCRNFDRVHVGRVNTLRWLWNSAKCGAESCDGTGFFRDPSRQRELNVFLQRYARGMDHPQLQLAFAETFYKRDVK